MTDLSTILENINNALEVLKSGLIKETDKEGFIDFIKDDVLYVKNHLEETEESGDTISKISEIKKVKVFVASSAAELEIEMNNWLSENVNSPNVTLKDVKYNFCVDVNNYSRHTAMIVYYIY